MTVKFIYDAQIKLNVCFASKAVHEYSASGFAAFTQAETVG
jgi:hypothetical protein